MRRTYKAALYPRGRGQIYISALAGHIDSALPIYRWLQGICSNPLPHVPELRGTLPQLLVRIQVEAPAVADIVGQEACQILRCPVHLLPRGRGQPAEALVDDLAGVGVEFPE